jgi:DNA helicase HerA-like ATPase
MIERTSAAPPRDAQLGSAQSEDVGVILGSMDATPLDFWIGVEETRRVQLDDLVVVETETPDGLVVRFYGMVDVVRKRYEGTQFDTDAFRATNGTLPVEVSYAAHVQVTRIDPEIFVPPDPGTPARVVRGEDFQRALYFDRMERRVAIGLTRTGEPIFANLEFMDGTRGAHASISGISGVATKTSYASFLLYSLFHSGALGTDATNARAIIFNVKGEDLLWLDRANKRLGEDARRQYRALGLEPGPFRSVSLYAPARRSSAVPMPDTGSRQEGVQPYVWTLREFAAERMLRFCFTETHDSRAQLAFVVHRVERELEDAVRGQPETDPTLTIDGQRLQTFDQLADLLDTGTLDNMVRGPVATGTLDAFRRRLHAAAARMGHLVRGNADAIGRSINWEQRQVTVVDIHALHSTAQMFVVGVLLKRMMEAKELRGTSRPLVFVLLDELNKYAPREGDSPISDVLLDIAERGRSLGISLLGAQQTASEVERRVVANCALRVVGRIDSAEAERSEYGFMGKATRVRATLLQPGTMIVAQPEIPVAVLVTFPFPSWATRPAEATDGAAGDPFARVGQ